MKVVEIRDEHDERQAGATDPGYRMHGEQRRYGAIGNRERGDDGVVKAHRLCSGQLARQDACRDGQSATCRNGRVNPTTLSPAVASCHTMHTRYFFARGVQVIVLRTFPSSASACGFQKVINTSELDNLPSSTACPGSEALPAHRAAPVGETAYPSALANRASGCRATT